MPIALSTDQAHLAETVNSFAQRHRVVQSTRKDADALRAGELPEYWRALLDTGLHSVHLSESVGGQGGSVEDAAVVLAEAGRTLVSGPLLPTIAASAVTELAGARASRDLLLTRFARGGTGAVIGPEHGVTVTDGERPRLNGQTDLVLGAASAELLIVAAHQGGADGAGRCRWFAVDRSAPGVACEHRDGVDLGRDIAVVRFGDVDVAEADRLTGIDDDAAADTVAALLAADAAGVVAWCAQAACDYVKTRTQFGKPIGAFQAVQHRAAQLLITSELATAAAWDAVHALGESPDQRARAVAGAAIMTIGTAVHAAVECLGLHGAIGFTWENDLHLYWRRAMSLAALAGPVEEWEARLGSIAVDGPRDMKLALPQTDPSFRTWVAEVLEEAATLSNPHTSPMGGGDAVATGARRTLLAERGLVGPPWPRPFGLDAGPLEQLIVREEFDRHGIEEPSMAIGGWLLPVIINRGNPEQIELLAGPTLRGEAIWCQLFSEPEAGSDVASLNLRATKVAGGWVLSGQKIWTTQAHLAHWGLCLARTDTDAVRHRGLSMFIIDMKNPALDVRPIKQANGQAEFNEVFFNDAFVPDSMMLGEPGQGWAVTIEILAQERLFIGNFRETGHEQRIRRIIRENAYRGQRRDALRALGQVSARATAIAAMNLRDTIRRLAGHEIGPATSIGKAAASMLHTDAAAIALNLIGPAAATAETDCEPVFHELDIPTWVIGGGTLEIQLNTIATFVMGLPRK